MRQGSGVHLVHRDLLGLEVRRLEPLVARRFHLGTRRPAEPGALAISAQRKVGGRVDPSHPGNQLWNTFQPPWPGGLLTARRAPTVPQSVATKSTFIPGAQ